MSRPAAGALAAWVLAAGLAFVLDRETAASPSAGTPSDAVRRLAGGVTEAVGDMLFIKANAYYHGGVEEEREESAELYVREGHIDDHHEAADRDWIARVNSRIRERTHYHLTQNEQKEMLPLLGLAVKLDPHNIEAVLTTAYWLERQLGKPEAARRVLEKGAADNPDSWEIDYRLAHLLIRRFKDHASARAWYEKALQKMGSDRGVEDYMRRNAWYSLGECYEALGDARRAKTAYENALKFFKPGDPEGLKNAIDAKLSRS